MKKIERIYREILINVLNNKISFTQSEISKNCEVALGHVNKVIRGLQKKGALQIMQRNFKIIDASRILLQWCILRKIKDESKAFSIDTSLEDLEKTILGVAIFTAFSGWKFLKKRIPADYREIYVYVNEKDRKMFEVWLNKQKINKNNLPNLYVIYSNDGHLFKNSNKNIAPIPQIIVDTYSISNLSSKYFFSDMIKEYKEFSFEV